MNDFEPIETAANDPENRFLAVQLYREKTGQSVLDSIDAIEQFQQTGNWDHLDSFSSNNFEEVDSLVLDGEMVPAIHLHRDITGKTLKESSQSIEKIQDYFLFTGERENKIEILYEHDGESGKIRTVERYQNAGTMADFQRESSDRFLLMFGGIFGTIVAFMAFVFGLLFYLGKFE